MRQARACNGRFSTLKKIKKKREQKKTENQVTIRQSDLGLIGQIERVSCDDGKQKGQI